MSERQVKRVRALEGRTDGLEGRILMLEEGMAFREERGREEARQNALAARIRARNAERREYVWRNVALGAVLAALIVCVAAALAVGASGAETADPAETVETVRVIPEAELRPAEGFASLEAMMEDGA